MKKIFLLIALQLNIDYANTNSVRFKDPNQRPNDILSQLYDGENPIDWLEDVQPEFTKEEILESIPIALGAILETNAIFLAIYVFAYLVAVIQGARVDLDVVAPYVCIYIIFLVITSAIAGYIFSLEYISESKILSQKDIDDLRAISTKLIRTIVRAKNERELLANLKSFASDNNYKACTVSNLIENLIKQLDRFKYNSKTKQVALILINKLENANKVWLVSANKIS